MRFKAMIPFGGAVRSSAAYVGLLSLLALSGCSDGGPKLPTVPVSGTVTYKGQPLDGAAVAFLNTDKESGKPANAVTDSQGRFELLTFLAGAKQAKGALPGDYVVTIRKVDTSGGGAGGGTTGGGGMPGAAAISGDPGQKGLAPEVKLLTPAKYADPAKPEFKATVKSGGDNTFKFELVD